MLLIIATSALFERWQLNAELQTEAAILHPPASQRADQQDAHLTSVSYLAVASTVDRRDLFLDVATRPGLLEVTSVAIVIAARSFTGRLVLQSAPEAEHSYLLVKRRPDSDDARFGLALQINASALIGSDNPF